MAGTLRGFDADHDLFVPVGRGMYGNMIAGDLEKLGYPILIREEESDNGYCLCLVEEDGERTFITVKGAEGCFRPSWFEQLSQDVYDSIYVAGYQVCGNSGRVISGWMEGAKDRMKEKRVFFAPGPVITDIDGDVMERILSVEPILHLNEKEAFDYTKQPSVELSLIHISIPTMIKALKEGGLEEAGAMLFSNNPMSLVCSLVCNHERQCEGHCVLGRKGQPVHVSSIENYICLLYTSRCV